MRKSLLSFAICAMLFVSCKKAVVNADFNVIPLPQEIVKTEGNSFILDSKTTITYPADNEALKRTAIFLSDYLESFTGLKLTVSPDAEGKVINLTANLHNENKDAYKLAVTEKSITINGASESGTFYGVQTLRKSVSPNSENKEIHFPAVEITDQPRFEYRASMLDVARHMFPADFVKKYIDLLALHNINYFHWHLTDDQGWRIEIKKYPELTEKSSIRKETLVGHLLNDTPHKFDGKPYGGYYTQDEIKEIVKYAQDRFITIIPEIDMPGHMLAALSVYPELGCTRGPYEVATKWGVFEDVLCAGNDKTYEFVENVLTEIMELFPSKYIHIGGDECPKTQWKACSKCQALIHKQGLKSDASSSAEAKLQSYAMSKIEKMLNKNDRIAIGWDEMLEGGMVSPNAVTMSWRGTEGGINAAKQHHKAIMVPHYSLYLNYNQGEDISKEPLSIGEYIPVHKVYDYEPVPSELTKDEAKYIIGVQANLWTEYIKTPSLAEYMLLPRMAALSEIQWLQLEKKDYASFQLRLGNMLEIYKKLGYNFAKHAYNISADINPSENKDAMELTLHTVGKGQIYYTTDGNAPSKESSKYDTPIKLTSSLILKAIAIHPDTVSGEFEYVSLFNKATYRPVELLTPTNVKYTFKGAPGLTDGIIGAPSFVDGNWVGFSGKNGMETIIDLGDTKEISKVSVGTLSDMPNWIFAVSGISVLVSEDGKNYALAGEKKVDTPKEGSPIERMLVGIEFSPTKARYVKLLVPSTIIPVWHEGKGTAALLFVDEIEIN